MWLMTLSRLLIVAINFAVFVSMGEVLEPQQQKHGEQQNFFEAHKGMFMR
jgi:hypothetical protein